MIQNRETGQGQLTGPTPTGARGDGPIALIMAVTMAVRRRLLPLAIWVLACLLLAFFHARSLPPVYTATATLILESAPQFRGVQGEAGGNTILDLNRVDSELQVIRSERLQRLVFDNLGLAQTSDLRADPAAQDPAVNDGSATQPAILPLPSLQSEQDRQREMAFGRFQNRFDARRLGQSYVIAISYSSSDPVLAARVANAGASAYLLQSVVFKAAAASGGGEFVQSRLDALSAEVEAAEAAVRQGTLPEIQIPDAGARIIGAATVPLSPSAPRVKLLAALGGMMGLLSGLFAVALGSALDRRVGNGHRLTAESGLARMALIPQVRGALSSGAGGNPNAAMALRDMRTAIDLGFGTDVGGQGRSIALVSWAAGAGCSALSTSLAQMMQRPDRSVMVVDADLRGGSRGLSARWQKEEGGVLTGNPPRARLRGVPLLPVAVLGEVSESLADSRDPRLAGIFTDLRRQGDVIIDMPPLSESADALALARLADVVILITTPYNLIDEILTAEQQLKGAGANVIGVTINDVGRRGRFTALGSALVGLAVSLGIVHAPGKRPASRKSASGGQAQ